MLSNRSLVWCGRLFAAFGFFGAIPYKWDKESHTIKTNSAVKQKALFFLCLYILLLVYWSTLIVVYYRIGDYDVFNIIYLFELVSIALLLLIIIMHWPEQGVPTFQMFSLLLGYVLYMSKKDNLIV